LLNKGINIELCIEKLGNELNGAILTEGAICDSPVLDFPISLLNDKGLVALIPRCIRAIFYY
jgi:hypothetical protein